jgi:PD-(D/E)XK endonuclease
MRVDFGEDGVWIRPSIVICRAGSRGEAARGFLPWIQAVAEEEDGAKKERNPKRLGELSQAAFLVKAQAMGFGLALPWGDSEKYDFVVWARPGGRLLRVQVKATGRLNGGGYDVQPVYSTRGEGKKIYTERDIDVLAACVVRQGKEDVWYLLPVRAFAGVKSLRLFPDLESRNPRWEGYREEWGCLG